MHAQRIRLAVSVLAAVLLSATAASASPAAHDISPGPWCGGTLWRLMNLNDPDRAKVQLHREPTTIADIAHLAAPKRIVAARTTGFQRQVWGLRAVVDRYRIASNGEVVLILYSIDSGRYMNAYLPNPHCLSAKTRDRTGLLAARKAFTSKCPKVTASWQLLGATVDLAGVGFWNPSRSTRGALPNGAELRPVTNLKLVSGCGTFW